MKKIPSLFVRDFSALNEGHTPKSNGGVLATEQVTLGCEWVIAGEGLAMVKMDGTACMVRCGNLFKRYDAKAFTVDQKTGERHAYGKSPPPGFEPCQEPDEKTGHWPGWIPVGDEPESKWHREAFAATYQLHDGTYELLGPKINGNPERLSFHSLLPHFDATAKVPVVRTFAAIREWLKTHDYEGLVFHHPDGRMCKVKKSDFGFKREGAK